MTAVLPHAPPEKTAVPKHKVHEPPVGKSGAAASHQPPAPDKGKFQALLEQAAPKAPVPISPAVPEKAKVLTAKAPEHPEKPKDTKRHDTKEDRTDAVLSSLAQSGALLPKSDSVNRPQKSQESDSLLSSTEKAKNQKADRRTGTENGQLSAWNPGSLETTRNRGPVQGLSPRSERSEEKPKIFVVDRRTESKEKEKLKLPGAETAAVQPVPNSADPQANAKTAESKNDQVQVAFQAVSGKGQGQGSFDVQAQNTPVSPRDAASFQQYLVERGYGQMVDQARIVLKDQNAGEIRMTLFPESLGKVKVSLNLTDSSLAGQIFVENQTVKDVFQANMDNLLQAFRDGGWNDLSLQVSVGGEKGPGNGGQPSHQAPQAQDYGRQVAQTVSDGPANRIGYWNDRQINLTA